MRRSIAKIPYPVIARATTIGSSTNAGFSTSSAGGGGGRGRGRANPFQFTVESSSTNEPENSKGHSVSPPPNGHGRGRGTQVSSSPNLPLFSSFLNSDSKAPAVGRGRGFIPTKSTSPPPKEEAESGKTQPNVKKSFLFVSDEKAQDDCAEPKVPEKTDVNLLSGAGRGKPGPQSETPKPENRHIRPRQKARTPPAAVASGEAGVDKPSLGKQLSQEEKVAKAIEILSKADQGGERGRAEGTEERGGGRGRGREMERESDIKRFDGIERDEIFGSPEDDSEELVDVDPADEEKLTKKLGVELMNYLEEEIDDIAGSALPNPREDAIVNALDVNLRIECEPEYLMEEFGTNPDIDEKPPIPLRDALEKMKPFLIAYTGIQSQEEWEVAIEETMKNVPLMQMIVDHYSGPDRVTAKQQQETLERVAKTLPTSAPDSVKRFTNRAVLSLQSNPGWRFDKKYQFMDKLVKEVSNQWH